MDSDSLSALPPVSAFEKAKQMPRMLARIDSEMVTESPVDSPSISPAITPRRKVSPSRTPPRRASLTRGDAPPRRSSLMAADAQGSTPARPSSFSRHEHQGDTPSRRPSLTAGTPSHSPGAGTHNGSIPPSRPLSPHSRGKEKWGHLKQMTEVRQELVEKLGSSNEVQSFFAGDAHRQSRTHARTHARTPPQRRTRPGSHSHARARINDGERAQAVVYEHDADQGAGGAEPRGPAHAVRRDVQGTHAPWHAPWQYNAQMCSAARKCGHATRHIPISEADAFATVTPL